ncbi:class I SAM-dependent methyltransferase [Polaromonas sp.]|uniref:class I SAM-dependent methyltransferase n=1 Tax=Polaromonas sp. TaxID=1869339 RepID=UPI003CC513ED
MKESSKTITIRGFVTLQQFLKGRVIDIGAGNDLICASAEGFDVSQGDANYITKFRPIGAYDAVCSSHCLEHMFNANDALAEWWALVKPGGYLLLTVPDEDLYEQGFFPSRFNSDHKATFRFRKPESWSPVSHDLESMVSRLSGARIISAELQSDNYDFSLQFKFGDRVGSSRLLTRIYLKLEKKLGYDKPLVKALRRRLFLKGVPIDQTHGNVLAQIQVVAQKMSDLSTSRTV